ncbi:MAG: tetratricopeptide repeat protein, partial [Candidatus Omnitrophota bacterium]|nr:tetratricopeptide repeat protein [Candidatus Omnitrophota bacterium]
GLRPPRNDEKRELRHSRNDRALKIAGFAVIAMSIASIIRVSAVKEFMESLLYGWRYFLILPEYARNFSSDCLLLAAISAVPAFLSGMVFFPGRKNKFIPFFLGIIISGFVIVNFLPAHRYEVVEKPPERFLKKDGRVIMDNRLSSIAAERLKVYLPFVLEERVKSVLFSGLGDGEAFKTAEGIPSIEKIVCLETDRYFKSKDNRIKVIRQSLKKYLSSSAGKFDLIVINDEDLALKKNAGLVRDHLADGGFLAAVLPLNAGDTGRLKISMAEYRALFGEMTVWMPHQTLPARLLVLCRTEKLGLEIPLLKEEGERIAKDESILRGLSGININNIFDLLDMLVFSEDALASYTTSIVEAPRRGEGEPILRRLTEPTAREVNMFHRDNITGIMRARSSPLELFKGEVPEGAQKMINRYYEATTNTVFGQIYKDINGFFGLGKLEFRTAIRTNPLDRDAAYALDIPGTFGNLIANARARFTLATEDIIKGKALLSEDKNEAAIEKFKEAVKKDPENELAHSCLAGAYQMAGEPDKALGEYKAIISSAGQFNPPPINAESIESIAVYRALEDVAMGIYYWDKGMMKEFMRSVKGVIDLGRDPGHVFPPYIADNPVFKRNFAYLKAKMPKTREYDMALETLGGYYSSMGHIYWLKGRYLKAIIYANGALRTTGRGELKEMIYSDLGTYFADAGEFESAEEYYKKALAINPNIPDINKYLKINTLELKRGKDPANAALYLELAQSYKDIFDLGKNVHYLEKALALDKNSKEIKFKYDEAVLQRMLSLNPDDSYGHNALGVLYWSNNEPYKAIRSFMISLEINPYFADAHFNLAMAYKAAGVKKKEAYHLKKALKLKPDMTMARQELDKIK